jgi:hypothetical protein
MNGTGPPAGKENGQQPGKNCCPKLKTPPRSSHRFDCQRPCLVETPLAKWMWQRARKDGST